VTYSIASLVNIETLRLLGTESISATGNSLANTLVGNAGDNVLDGGAGNDSMSGGAGNDTYVVDQTGDSVSDSAGIDTVLSFVNYTLGSAIENLTLMGSGNLTGNGNASSNIITGNSGNNVIDGRGGSDSMSGLLGDDTFFVDNIGDQVIEAANQGIDTVNSSISYALGNNVENLTLTGTASVSGTGNALNNSLMGNSGSNVLNGGAGNDVLSGGAGSDTFVFSNLPGSANADLIQDFTSADRIQLDNAVMAALGGNGNFTSNDARFWASGSGQAHDASDRVVYNTNSGQLWYDADGNGAGTAQLIATLQDDPTLLASQISVI
jgi:Ca2+-binding RTX toxin-like protein